MQGDDSCPSYQELDCRIESTGITLSLLAFTCAKDGVHAESAVEQDQRWSSRVGWTPEYQYTGSAGVNIAWILSRRHSQPWHPRYRHPSTASPQSTPDRLRIIFT